MTSAPRSAYIHVPFCAHRCGYCDFAVIAGRDDLIDSYLGALELELSRFDEAHEVDTLYFGGGTPSHLNAEQLRRLIDLVLARHPLAAGHEFTIEANPESLAADSLGMLQDHDLTRVSLGVQSFNDAKLAALDRRHDRVRAIEAVKAVQRLGLQTCVDLIFAAPGETLDDWRRDLDDAIALAPDHISSYGLTFERGTPFTVSRNRGQLREVDEELQLTMYAKAIDALAAAGYEHYEVSNFARPGRRSRHNEVYWAGKEYYAAGPGAARYVGGVRETNVRSTQAYIRLMNEGQSPVAEQEHLEPEQRAREMLVLGLRRLEGVDKAAFQERSGYKLEDLAASAIAKHIAAGFLQDDGRTLRLTREGLYVSDAIWPDVL